MHSIINKITNECRATQSFQPGIISSRRQFPKNLSLTISLLTSVQTKPSSTNIVWKLSLTSRATVPKKFIRLLVMLLRLSSKNLAILLPGATLFTALRIKTMVSSLRAK